MTIFKRIMVPVDGSRHANKATEIAAGLAKLMNARLTLLHVMTETGSDGLPEELREFARIEHLEVLDADVLVVIADQILANAERTAAKQGATLVHSQRETGSAAEKILTGASEQDVDLIVMGRRGLGTVQELFLGSVSHQVTQSARCACMTVV